MSENTGSEYKANTMKKRENSATGGLLGVNPNVMEFKVTN